jgi:hypothetical protein
MQHTGHLDRVGYEYPLIAGNCRYFVWRDNDPAPLGERSLGSRTQILHIAARMRPHRSWHKRAISVGPEQQQRTPHPFDLQA